MQWLVDAYALSLAAFLLTAGAVADRFGRRLVFSVGIVVFTAGSLLCGVAADPAFLAISRALQGVGGAIMFAVSLALVAQEFPSGPERGMAMGIYGGTIGMANWTPDGFIGQMFRVTGRYVAPPAGLMPPSLWGTEVWVPMLAMPVVCEF